MRHLVFLMGIVAATSTAAWSSPLEALLHEPVTTGFLLLGMLTLLPALLTIGTGVGETVTLLCFAFFFAGRYNAHPDVLPPILFLCGVGFLAVEALVVPGLGKPAFIGFILISAGIVKAYPDHQHGMLVASGAGLALAGGLLLSLKFLRHRFGGRLALQTKAATSPPVGSSLQMFVGQRGTALTALRPSGLAEFEGCKVDVRCLDGFIEKGAPLEGVRVDGSQLIVKG